MMYTKMYYTYDETMKLATVFTMIVSRMHTTLVKMHSLTRTRKTLPATYFFHRHWLVVAYCKFTMSAFFIHFSSRPNGHRITLVMAETAAVRYIEFSIVY